VSRGKSLRVILACGAIFATAICSIPVVAVLHPRKATRESIVISRGNAQLFLSANQQLMGHRQADGLKPQDLTERVKWRSSDSARAAY